MTKNIMIVGVGGQGTLLTSRILGMLAINGGYDVKLSEVHGMAQRGGSVVTFVRYGDKVAKPVLEVGEVDVLLAFEELEALRYAHFVKPEGIIIVNEHKIAPMPVIIGVDKYPLDVIEQLVKKNKTIAVKGTSMACEIGNPKCFNVVLLGVASKFMDFSTEEWSKVINELVPKRALNDNIEAFNQGLSLANS